MPRIIVLPHEELCPGGAVIEAKTGESICDNLLENGVEIEHACEKSCACTTCHVVVREGFQTLDPSEEKEDDLLDKAWDPQLVRFTDLFKWVQELDGFDDDPKRCGEKILEAIQMAWTDEVD